MLAPAHSECIYFRCTKINGDERQRHDVKNNANARSHKAIRFSKDAVILTLSLWPSFAVIAIIVVVVAVITVLKLSLDCIHC